MLLLIVFILLFQFTKENYRQQSHWRNKIEIHKGMRNMTLLSPENIKNFTEAEEGAVIIFTGHNCNICSNQETQVSTLASVFKKEGRKVKFGLACIRKYPEFIKKYDIHFLPDLRVYYRGIYNNYAFGENYSTMARFIDGRLKHKDIIEVHSKKKFDEYLKREAHLILYYGEHLHQVDRRLDDLIKMLHFELHPHFIFLKVGKEELARKLGIEQHLIYEYNSYDKKFTKIPLKHLLDEKSFDSHGIIDKKDFYSTVEWIRRHSHRAVLPWSNDHLKEFTTLNFDRLIFYSRENDVKSEKRFNQTCEGHLRDFVQCYVFSYEENIKDNFTNIVHADIFDHNLPATGVLHLKMYDDRNEVFIMKFEENIKEKDLINFYENSEAGKIEQYFEKSEKIPNEKWNKKKLIKKIVAKNFHDYLRGDHDFYVVFHDPNKKEDQEMMNNFEIAVEAVNKIWPGLKIVFGEIDCEKNIVRYFSPNQFPAFVYFRSFEHKFPFEFTRQDSDFMKVEDIIEVIEHEYIWDELEDMVEIYQERVSEGLDL